MTMKKQNTLHRFAAVAAVLLTLCLVFIMPVVADGVTYMPAYTYDELKSNLSAGNSVILMEDITENLPADTPTDADCHCITIPSGKEVTLNLNNHKITITDTTTVNYNFKFIEVKGTLTVIDGSGDIPGEISVTVTKPQHPNHGKASYVLTVEQFGKLTINDGIFKIDYNGSDSLPLMYVVNSLYDSSELTINGGKLTSSYVTVRAFTNSNVHSTGPTKVTITGGEISGGKWGLQIHHPNTNVRNKYEVLIEGGTISGTNRGIYHYIQDSDVGGSTTITGGTIIGTSEGAIVYNTIVDLNEDYSLKISDGTLVGNTPLLLLSGTYTNEPNVDLTEVKLAGLNAVSSTSNLLGTFTVPAIGKSYEWSVSGTVLDGSSNEKEITFDPTKGSTQTVSVKIVLSDTTSTTITKDVSVPAKYEVTYNADGGEGTMNPAYAYSDNNVIDLPPCTFTAPGGKVFKAWQIGNTEYAAGVSYTVTADTSVTAVWKEVGAAVAPSLGEDVADVNHDGTTEINTSADNVEPDEINKKVTITDQSTGVTIEVQFDDNAEVTDSSAEGTVTSVTVNYQPEQTVVSEHADGEEITQTVSFTLSTVTTELPTISSAFDPNKAEKVIAENPNHKPLAMITADNAESVNNNMTQGTDKVTVTFKLPQALVESLVGTDTSLLKAYHVKDNGDVIEAGIEVDGPTNGYYYVEVTGDGFSSYVLGYEEPKTNIGNNGGGSATDTGSGNYQYYPRSVPADGIVDFGTSKVVTGMELPAGSDGTVTLNIKPTFAMPENGFYAFEIDAPGYNTNAKINGGLSFQIPVADLEAAGWTAEDIVLFHGTVGEDGKITWEALPTNLVKNENGVAYYKAAIAGCSPFYIGFVKDGSVVNTEVVDPVTPETPVTPVTPDEPEVLPPVDEPETPEQPTESPAPILAVLAGLGAAVVLRRK